MPNNGWITIHRQIEDSAIWNTGEPFDKRSAWIDLILIANHEDKEIFVNGNPLTVHRGQKFTSIRALAAKWMWSKDKVIRFLKTLERSGMITYNRTHNGTLLTLVNYEFFQGTRDTKRDANKDTHKDNGRTRSGRAQATNKECNNVTMINKETNKAAPPDCDTRGNKLQ